MMYSQGQGGLRQCWHFCWKWKRFSDFVRTSFYGLPATLNLCQNI